jgi:hemoglobin-like flavoprotein
MGAAHHACGVKDVHFPIVGESLLHAIEAYDSSFDAPTLAAWTKGYGFMAGWMQRGMARACDLRAGRSR